MQLTRIDFEGQGGCHATAQRRKALGAGPNMIVVTILCPATPDGREHYVLADCKEDLFSMAECLQAQLEGCRGTNSMVCDYYDMLLRLSDL